MSSIVQQEQGFIDIEQVSANNLIILGVFSKKIDHQNLNVFGMFCKLYLAACLNTILFVTIRAKPVF